MKKEKNTFLAVEKFSQGFEDEQRKHLQSEADEKAMCVESIYQDLIATGLSILQFEK